MVSSGETAPNAPCSIDDALKFLKGPSDEHKFAGLLLVPKVCAQNEAVKYKQLYDALGLDFLWRLLVPLRDPRFIATVDDPEDVKKQLLGVTLSLSVLSILTRDGSVAQDPELIKLFPCLARILRSQSLCEACGKQSDASELDNRPSEASDAVEIVWNICTHEQEAVRIALESRLLSSVAAWLSRSFLVQPTEVLSCGLSLLFTVAQPLLPQEDGDGGLAWHTDQVSFPPEMLGSEIRAAVEGVSFICSVECVAEQDVASGASARKALQVYGFSVLAALAPAMKQCPESVQAPASISEQDDNGVYSIAWCNNLKTASLRALKNKLPPQHTMNILLALQTMTDQHGAAALLQKPEGGARVTDLMLTVSQVIKVHIFSHLQGCSLEVQAGRGSKPLPSYLLTSQSSFRAAVHMIAQLVDLAIMLDSSADEPGDQEPSSSAQVPLVATAAMERTIIEALLAVKDTVQSMLDFILLCVRGDLVDGPEPEQIPKGFRRPEPAPNQSAEGTDQVQQDSDPSLDVSMPQMKKIGADGTAYGDTTPDPNWAQDSLQQCCHCVGYFLSMAGDEDLFLKLFSGLPALCSWMLGVNDEAPVKFVSTPVAIRDVTKSIMLALYSTHVLRSSAPAVVSACTKACQAPEVVICLCTCCRSMIDSMRTEAEVDTEDKVWHSRFLSPVETMCELLTSVLCSKTEVAANADSLHAKLHASKTEADDDSIPSESLMQQTALAVHKFVCTIAPKLGEHANTCEDGDDVTEIVDTIVATAELMLVTTDSSVSLQPGDQRWVGIIAAVAEALRIAVEYVLRVVEADYTPLIRSLVSGGQDSKSCWSGGGEHLLLACVEDDVDVSRVADKCAQICSRLCACLEEHETATKVLCEQTWLDPWLRSNDHVYQIVSVLENSEETVSLGHSLRLLAVSLQY